MIIEANWGLGESVVGGEALPDVYVLDKESLEIVDTKLGSKEAPSPARRSVSLKWRLPLISAMRSV